MGKRGTSPLIFKVVAVTAVVILFAAGIHLLARLTWVALPDYIASGANTDQRTVLTYSTDAIGHFTAHSLPFSAILFVLGILFLVGMLIQALILKIKKLQRTRFRSTWLSHPSTEEIRVVKGRHSSARRN